MNPTVNPPALMPEGRTRATVMRFAVVDGSFQTDRRMRGENVFSIHFN